MDLAGFSALMEEALLRHPMPRAYLLPSQAARTVWEEPTFKPALCTKSKARAPQPGGSCKAIGAPIAQSAILSGAPIKGRVKRARRIALAQPACCAAARHLLQRCAL